MLFKKFESVIRRIFAILLPTLFDFGLFLRLSGTLMSVVLVSGAALPALPCLPKVSAAKLEFELRFG